MKVIKRDGRVVDFNREKIAIAIEKANQEVTEKERADKQDIKDIIKYIETIQAFLPYLIYWNDMTASLLHNTAGISNTRMISIVTRF